MTANSNFPFLSVVIPACNPGMRHFQIVLEALRDQTLLKDRWELVVVDDASKQPLVADQGPRDKTTKGLEGEALIDLSWHPNARLVETDAEREGLGLVSARLRGFELGKGDVFVFVDQDNALRPDYLQGVADIAVEYPHIGTWGGQILLKFDEPDKAPEKRLWASLCTKEFQGDVWSNVVEHHASTPVGAGLCARREVLSAYREAVLANPMRRLLDPTPRGPGFGGDTDIAYAGIRAGYGKGIFDRLVLDHLTPAGRCSDQYIIKNAEGLAFSAGLHGYVETGRISPPRNDWRFWAMSWARRPGMQRLDWELLLARQRGRLRASKEIPLKAGELQDYARRLHTKAVALDHGASR